MQIIQNVHAQFASFFKDHEIQPFVHLLSKKLSEGHICVDPEAVFKDEHIQTELLPDGDKTNTILEANLLVSTAEGPKRPFVWHRNRLYFQRYFYYESGILGRIGAFLENEKNQFTSLKTELLNHKKQVRKLFVEEQLNAESPQFNWQMCAALMALVNSFTIISGGPGTGKTTTVAKILALLFEIQPDAKVALAAPTGKAAYRMAESLKNAANQTEQTVSDKFSHLEPKTIHRLLKARGKSTHFGHNTDNPLNYDLVIVDEASMIDVSLFYKLMDAIPNGARLILLGDKDQLASVEAGSVLGDLCQTQKTLNLLSEEKANFINSFLEDSEEKFPDDLKSKLEENPLSGNIIQLKHSHRFSGEKGIGLLSNAIINNQTETLKRFLDKDQDDAISIDKNYESDKFESFANGYKEFIQEPDIAEALKKLNNLRVLCAIREGEQGVYSANKKIENYLHHRGLINTQNEFYENRPVMVLQNNPALGLFNGDTGIVRKNKNEVSRVWFEDAIGQLKSFIPGHIGAVETVFATTIHKSQGSEFNKVLVLLPDMPELPILTRELVYTAVTRARNFVLLQTSAETLLAAAQRGVERVSGLTHRIDELI
ncbi:exodeoxyribonuclease V subunit alpha [Marinilabiliaceae bacterium ANBcel2]|nr:exodeoxyribonuclease V subunit alpha [Marinilabiliaceae bacterium ANBcel2]